MDRQTRQELADSFSRVDKLATRTQKAREKYSKISLRKYSSLKEEIERKKGVGYQDADLMTYLMKHVRILGRHRPPCERKLQYWSEAIGEQTRDRLSPEDGSSSDEESLVEIPPPSSNVDPSRNYARYGRSTPYFENRKADPHDPLLTPKLGPTGLALLSMQKLEPDTRNLPKHFMRLKRHMTERTRELNSSIGSSSADSHTTEEPLRRNMLLLNDLQRVFNVQGGGRDNNGENQMKVHVRSELLNRYSTAQLEKLTATVGSTNPLVLSRVKRLVEEVKKSNTNTLSNAVVKKTLPNLNASDLRATTPRVHVHVRSTSRDNFNAVSLPKSNGPTK